MPSQSSHQLAQNVIYTPANQNVIYTSTNNNETRPNYSTMSMSNMSHYNAATLQQTNYVEKPTLSTKTIIKSNSKAFTNANSSLKKSTTHVKYENEKPAVEMRVKGTRKIRPVSEGTFFLDLKTFDRDIDKATRQKLFVLRHGERVDTTFGINWTDNSFDISGRYIRFNLNMPKKMPRRENPKYEFRLDPPLTEMGLHQAKLTGEELAAQGISVAHCYASPALRSIQTADKLLEGMNLKHVIPIKIELGLFEYLRWQPLPAHQYPFMSPESLKSEGYNIEVTYNPVITHDLMRHDENEEYYYHRSYLMTKTITDKHSYDGGNIMFVGHAPTIEVCTRQLCGGAPRVDEFRQLVKKVPFLAIAQCEKSSLDNSWKLKQPQIPTLKHLGVEEFDWKNLKKQSTANVNDVIHYVNSMPHLPTSTNNSNNAYATWRI